MEARENGVMVVIATGRMHCTAVSATAPIGDDLPIASYNGALLNMTARGPELWRIPVPPSEGGRIARLLFEKGIAFHAYFDDQMYAPRMSQYTAEYEAKYGARSMILEDIDEYGRRESLKYLVLAAPEELDAVEPVVRSVAGESLTVMRSQPGLLEIISCASKGQAPSSCRSFRNKHFRDDGNRRFRAISTCSALQGSPWPWAMRQNTSKPPLVSSQGPTTRAGWRWLSADSDCVERDIAIGLA